MLGHALVLAAVMLPGAADIAAQSEAAPARPRVGLVLGGGGARGGAHVGVLRVLEEMRIPIDAIVGTSMGAIVGGLYAAGTSAEQIERQLATIEWSTILDAKPPRREIEYRRKQDDPHLLVKFELGFQGGRFRFPTGVIAAHRPNLLLKLLTLPAAAVTDFNALRVPFRAVATDIGTGQMVVLDHGDLPSAILASMSIPAVFPPVLMEGRYLVDGGVVRNLPIDVVRDMGVDIVIAVDVGTMLSRAEDLSSAVDVYAQTLTIFTRGNADAQLRDIRSGDVLISPDLGTISSTDFHLIARAIDAGRDAANSIRARLAPLSLPQAAWDSLSRARETVAQPVVLDFVRVENTSRVSSRVIEGRLTLQAGDTLEPTKMADAIDRVYGLGLFDRVDFSIVQENGQQGLVVRPAEKPWGPNYIRFGLGLTDEPDGNSTFELRTQLTMTGIGSRGADFRTEARAGEIRGLEIEYYQPLGWQGTWFIAPAFEAVQSLADVFESRVRIGQYDAERLHAVLSFGRQLGRFGEFRLGAERRWIVAEPEIGEPGLPRYDVGHSLFSAQLAIDRIDDVYFPRRGQLASVRFERGRASDGVPAFSKLHAHALNVFSRGPHTVLTGAELGTAFGSPLPLYEEFQLGGFLRLSGLRRRHVAGRYLGLGRFIYMNRIGDAVGLSFAGGLRAGGSLEIGNAWNDVPAFAADQFRFGISAFVGLETLLGPFYAASAIADRGRRAWYLFLGQVL
jgi:NTE family protein